MVLLVKSFEIQSKAQLSLRNLVVCTDIRLLQRPKSFIYSDIRLERKAKQRLNGPLDFLASAQYIPAASGRSLMLRFKSTKLQKAIYLVPSLIEIENQYILIRIRTDISVSRDTCPDNDFVCDIVLEDIVDDNRKVVKEGSYSGEVGLIGFVVH